MPLGLLDVSRGSGETLTGQLTDRLRLLIRKGRLKPGQRLPSSRDLARSLGLSRNTVSCAIEQLTAEGYLETSQGRRPVVTAGLVVERSEPRSKRTDLRAHRPRPSLWARDLHRAGWPPAYKEIPQPLQPGLADGREFPHDTWARCLRRAAGAAHLRARRLVNHPALQDALLRHLTEHRGVSATPDQIMIVPTAQAGLALIAKTMLDTGDTAWIESPGYGGALAALQTVGATVIGVPLDAAGLHIGRSETAPRLIFVTPSHQYPTGRLMSVGRRFELLRFAARVGASIIEDDYDGEFHYEARPVAALQGLASAGNVLYVGTFSKSMFADIRIGYVIVPEALVETFKLAQRHLGSLAPITTQVALAEFIASGDYLAHVRKMVRIYKTRRDRLVEALTAETRNQLAIDVPAGGMQLLARCRPSLSDRQLASRLRAAGVIALPLSSMVYHGTRDKGLFLGFAAWNEAEIDAAAHIIGRNVR